MLLDLLLAWAPDEAVWTRILVDNPGGLSWFVAVLDAIGIARIFRLLVEGAALQPVADRVRRQLGLGGQRMAALQRSDWPVGR